MLIEIQLNLKIFHRSKIENFDEKLNTIPNLEENLILFLDD